jgi:endonuclease/exonuclease/phosphatase (EEP) superfamily protein YafD
MTSPLLNLYRRALAVAAYAALFGVALAFSDGVFWAGSPARPWTPLLAVLVLGIALLLVFGGGRRGLGAVLILAAAALAADCGASLVPAAPAGGKVAAGELTLASVNLAYFNTDAGRVLPWLAERNPDVVVFLETTEAHHAALAPFRQTHPYVSRADAPHDAASLAVFSRFPLGESVRFGRRGPLPQLMVEIELPGGPLRLYAVHLFPPLGPEAVAWQEAVAAELTERLAADAAARVPVVVAGDFNYAPWSPAFRRLEERGRLAHGRRGRGVLPTWPESPFVAWFGIPLDHVLVGGGVTVRDFVVGPWIGSDHRPVVARLGVP